ncbi:hypothetical protein ACFFX1_02900 [Dactylosporangium sucinum]|uniref:Flavohemoprotein n=1 Tax=Dactylosporangium sucinum TaxID=1424081 RepID=A0A917U8L6_9ACTN|nr:hypothetical protein [Dactylosporangium sucinum]GGM65255.1 flavohemoprotein [Dactylosporangium sucinum]
MDGPKAGDQGYLSQLQAKLRERADPRRIVERLAGTPPKRRTVLHAAVAHDPAAAERGFAWLLEHFDQPSAVVPALAPYAPALDALTGARGRQFELFAESLLDAVRAEGEWSDDDELAWRDAWRFAVGWLRQGAQLFHGEAPFWTGTVLAHDRRRDDVAVLTVRTDLPYPFRAGQRAIVEAHQVPGAWRACWIGDPPAEDHRIEIHVQALPGDDATGVLVRDTRPGDPIRLHRAEGDFVIGSGSAGAVLVVAEDVHVTPVKALLSGLAERGDERVVHLFWGVSVRDDLYDLESLREHAARCAHATVHPVVARGPAHPYLSGSLAQVVVDFAEWTSHDVYLSGSPFAVGVLRTMLLQRRVAGQRIHTVTLEPFTADATPSSSR